jgi:hypothetical protein
MVRAGQKIMRILHAHTYDTPGAGPSYPRGKRCS